MNKGLLVYVYYYSRTVNCILLYCFLIFGINIFRKICSIIYLV